MTFIWNRQKMAPKCVGHVIVRGRQTIVTSIRALRRNVINKGIATEIQERCKRHWRRLFTMTNNQIYYYGGIYPVQTSLVAPKQALMSTDLSEQAAAESNRQCDLHNLNLTLFADQDISTRSCDFLFTHPNHNSSKRVRVNEKIVASSPCSPNGFLENDLSKSDDCEMDFEIYQTSLVKNAFAPCPLQVPLEENNFCPRATSTPTTSPENITNYSYRGSPRLPQKPVKRKLQFVSEDDEAVYYLKTKYTL